jgi:hypothetical protein
VHGVARDRQAPSHRVRDVRRARLGSEDLPAGLGAEQRACRRLAGADRKRRRHPREQRRVAEALPGFEHLDRLAVVHDVHRPGDDHPQSASRQAILDQHGLPGVVGVLDGAGGERPQLLRIERVERRVMGKECVQVLHVEPRNCVRIAPGTYTGHVGA